MSMGFITLATGSNMYYKAAYRLLQSYRYRNGKHRFCIVCDRENIYTKQFDDVIVLDKCCFDYRDKFELLKAAPYDRNIFVEPDCLLYKNIDDFWLMFESATPLSAFGYNCGSLDFWFDDKEYVKNIFDITEIPIFNPGYLYIEKSDCIDKCYNDLIAFSQTLKTDHNFSNEQKIFHKQNLRDDPVFCLVMQKNNCTCAIEQKIGKCISLPSIIKIDRISVSDGNLDVLYNLNGESTTMNSCYLLHFSSRRLKEWLYFQQSLSVFLLSKKCPTFIVRFIESNYFGLLSKKLFKLKSELYSIFKIHRKKKS